MQFKPEGQDVSIKYMTLTILIGSFLVAWLNGGALREVLLNIFNYLLVFMFVGIALAEIS